MLALARIRNVVLALARIRNEILIFWYSMLVGERERSGAPGIRVFMRAPCSHRAHAAASEPARVAVSLRPDLGGLAIHEVQRRNVADRAVQANPVVIFDESFHQAASPRLVGLAR